MMSKAKTTQSQQLTTPRAAGLAGILAGGLFITSHVLILISLSAYSTEPGANPQDQTCRVSLALQLLPFAGTVFLGSGLLYLAMTFIATALAGGLWSFFAGNQAIASETVYNASRTLIAQITNVYGLRMAAVFMLSSATMWMRTQVVPRWLAILTALLALVLLVTIGLSPWLPLLFPVWILIVSILILISNYRRKAQSGMEEAID